MPSRVVSEVDRKEAHVYLKSMVGDGNPFLAALSKQDDVILFESTTGRRAVVVTVSAAASADVTLLEVPSKSDAVVSLVLVLPTTTDPTPRETISLLKEVESALVSAESDAVGKGGSLPAALVSFVRERDLDVLEAFAKRSFDAVGRGESPTGDEEVYIVASVCDDKALRQTNGRDLMDVVSELRRRPGSAAAAADEAKVRAEERRLELEQEKAASDAMFWQVLMPLALIAIIAVISVVLVQMGFFRGISEFTLDGSDPLSLRWRRAQVREQARLDFEARMQAKKEAAAAAGVNQLPEEPQFVYVEDDGEAQM